MSESTTERIRLAAVAKRQRDEWDKYHDLKRLAEKAWAGMQSNHEFTETPPEQIASQAWKEAEAMYAESERRRPVE
jgi:hypothetical protein